MGQQNVVKNGFIKQKNIENVVLANLICLAIVFALGFIPYFKIFLPEIVFLCFEVGLLGIIFEIKKGQKIKHWALFSSFRNATKICGVFVAKIFLFLFWAVLLVVPGIVCLLDYSFANLIIYECPALDIRGVLLLSKEMTKNYRLKIFLSCTKAFVCSAVCGLLMFAVVKIFSIWFVVSIAYYLFFVAFSVVISTLLVGLPIIEFCIVDSYISSKKSKTQLKTTQI